MRRLLATVTAPAVGLTLPSIVPEGAVAEPVTLVFNHPGGNGMTGAVHTWTVPTDVHEATFTLDGASGASSLGRPGVAGASLTAVLVVTPGQGFFLRVGGSPFPLGMGGFNGGGGTIPS